jgi:FKBP-type peptidyl-prolyl cis-trans isomerase
MKFVFIIAAIVLVGGAVAFFAFSDHRAEAASQAKNRGATMAEFEAAQKEFLVENAKKPGWKTTASGLQYHVIAETKDKNAPRPAPGSVVKVHYEGRLIDGTVFDSSYKRNEPISFPLRGVIEGWQEGVPLMQVGDTWEFAIPSELGYGDQGGGPIPPGATLLFKIELLEARTPAK